MFKKEVECFVLLGILEVANDSEWGDPYFAKTKPRSNQIHYLRYLRNLNKKLKQKPYPIVDN